MPAASTVVFPDQVVGESYVRSGYVRALAVTSKERSQLFPNVEAIAEDLSRLRDHLLLVLRGAQGDARTTSRRS